MSAREREEFMREMEGTIERVDNLFPAKRREKKRLTETAAKAR